MTATGRKEANWPTLFLQLFAFTQTAYKQSIGLATKAQRASRLEPCTEALDHRLLRYLQTLLVVPRVVGPQFSFTLKARGVHPLPPFPQISGQLQVRCLWQEAQVLAAAHVRPPCSGTRVTLPTTWHGRLLQRFQAYFGRWGKAAVAACFGRWGKAAAAAAFVPRWKHDLQQLQQQLQAALDNAEKFGAFKSALPIPTGLPRFYIRHAPLWQQVVHSIEQQQLQHGAAAVAAAEAGGVPASSTGGLRGVLITGQRGMGKSTLALDVA